MITIGIIGGSGTDKLKISRLYGQTLHWMVTRADIPDEMTYDFMIEFNKWCDEIDGGNYTDSNTHDVYYASFSHPLKMAISMITGIPFDLLSSHDKKHNYIVNVSTLEYKEKDDTKTITPEKLFKKRNSKLSLEYNDKQILPEEWMTLNDYVIYFGYYLCRNYMGRDIWTMSEKKGIANFPPDPNSIRIYTDIRSLSEYNLIKELGGIVIRINQKECNVDSVINDYQLFTEDVDIDMMWFSNIRGLCEDIYKNCAEIIRRSTHEYDND